MESEGRDSNVRPRPQIDLNEVPISSPAEAQEVVIPVPASVTGLSMCSVCGIPAGRLTEQPQEDWRCFHCLLKNGGSGSGGGVAAVRDGGGVFNINASSPREAETQRKRNLVDMTADVAVLVRRDPQVDHGGSCKFMVMEKKIPSLGCTMPTPSQVDGRLEGTRVSSSLFDVDVDCVEMNMDTFAFGAFYFGCITTTLIFIIFKSTQCARAHTHI